MQGDIESVLNSDTLSNYFNRNVSIIKQNRRYSLFLNEDKIAENQRK